MKKYYITPAVRCINIDTAELLANSIDKGDGPLNGEGDILSNERTPSSFIWGDED